MGTSRKRADLDPAAAPVGGTSHKLSSFSLEVYLHCRNQL